MYLVKQETREQENLLKQGYYLFRHQDNRILWLSHCLDWEIYANFETNEEARNVLDYILCSYKECVECEVNPFRVKNQHSFPERP